MATLRLELGPGVIGRSSDKSFGILSLQLGLVCICEERVRSSLLSPIEMGHSSLYASLAASAEDGCIS
jgi:hypothetical protein